MVIAFDPHTAVDLRTLAVRTGDEGALQVIEPVLDALVAPRGNREKKFARFVSNFYARREDLGALGVGDEPAAAVEEVIGNQVGVVGVTFDLEEGLVREGVYERDKGTGSPA
jgi:hypothetical protein